jgi:hypothetical protein
MAYAILHPISTWRHYRIIRERIADLARPSRRGSPSPRWQIVKPAAG